MNATQDAESETVPVDIDRLSLVDSSSLSIDLQSALRALRDDKVVLIRNLDAQRADAALRDVAGAFGLLANLELQASFADMLRHRRRVGAYRMTVNARPAHQFIPPHSEGDSFTALQLASFFCSANSTDGGVSVLVNIDDSSPSWRSLRELVQRLPRGSRTLTAGEMRRATAMFHLHSPPYIRDDDVMVGERPTAMPGVRVADVLAAPRRIRSVILERDLYSYWDNISSTDRSAVEAHAEVLRSAGLLMEPFGFDIFKLDSQASRRIWSSGVDHLSLFRCKVQHKLTQGDLVLLNNFTWTHSVTNWTPESGFRDVSAAFA